MLRQYSFIFYYYYEDNNRKLKLNLYKRAKFYYVKLTISTH